MLKFETHMHPFGGSDCADGNNNLVVKKYLQAGYDGIITTTHYSQNYYNNKFEGRTHKQKIDYFFKCHDDFALIAESEGLKTYFAAEIRVLPTNTEYMLVGFDRDFLYNNPPLFMLSQRELFDLSQKNGFFMYQTHPFRDGVNAGEPKFMHGAESTNGHYHHYNNNHLATKFCLDNKLICLSGTDYHHDDQPVTAGVYFNSQITSVNDIVLAFKKNDFLPFCNDEFLIKKF